MSVQESFDSRLTPEGRATVPAAVRRALGVRPGDVIQFVVDGADVRVVTGKALTVEMWSKNHGGDAGDSTAAVRQARGEDIESSADRWSAIDETEPDARSDDEVEAAIVAALDA